MITNVKYIESFGQAFSTFQPQNHISDHRIPSPTFLPSFGYFPSLSAVLGSQKPIQEITRAACIFNHLRFNVATLRASRPLYPAATAIKLPSMEQLRRGGDRLMPQRHITEIEFASGLYT